jgi:hypothetical protein
MTSKKDRTTNSVTNVITVISNMSRAPMIGVRNTSVLSVITKKAKTSSNFVSHFNPDVTSKDILFGRLVTIICSDMYQIKNNV